jgi:methionyl-tRNA formyltransferase
MTKLVFFGTGPVSRATLDGISSSFEIEAVVTKPSSSTTPAPVEEWAKKHGVPIHMTSNREELAQLFKKVKFTAKLGLVVDYGIIIPSEVIDSFPLGIVNSHFSLLPLLRGADPITFALLEGHKETGVSLMLIVPALDEGPILAQESLTITPDMSGPKLTEELVILSNKLIQKVLPQYENGLVKPLKQNTKVAPTYTKKLKKSDGLIDWRKKAITLEREIRAFLGWPGSFCDLSGQRIIVTSAHTTDDDGQPGLAYKTASGELAVYCGEGSLVIDTLKPAGKKEMSGRAWLAGHSL